MPYKICALVLNSVSHDIRVIKEAESLAAAGHDVHIVGIQDANAFHPFEKLASGVTIHRLPVKSVTLKPSKWWYRTQLAVFSVLAFLIFKAPEFISLELLFSALSIAEAGGAIGVIESLIQLAAFSGLFALYYFVTRKFKNSKKSHRRTRSMEKMYGLTLIGSPAVEEAHKYYPEELEDFINASIEKKDDTKTKFIIPRLLFIAYKIRNSGMIKRGWKNQSREKHIAKHVMSIAPDVVHCHDLATLPIGALAKKDLGCKLVFDAHEIYDQLAQTAEDERLVSQYTLRLFAPIVDKFITINDSIAEYYRARYPDLPPATIIRNAVKNTDIVSPDNRLRKLLSLPSETKILIYQGGFGRNRGLEELVRSAEMLPPNWVLVMMGWGSLEKTLREIAENLRPSFASDNEDDEPVPSARVRFIPKMPQEELQKWTAGATIGIIPYELTGLNHWFCTPNKLWEYPSAGVPILASPFPEIIKILDEHKIGWTLPNNLTAGGIVAKIAGLSDEEIQAASENCNSFIQKDNWGVYHERLVQMYQTI